MFYETEYILSARTGMFITCNIYINIQSDRVHQTNSEAAPLKSNE